ncbi:MAG: hypothetical protein CMJ62_19730 [Planctomycetaceae bacterium]|nr:hypothetical protein [Planctomycetaceae bacterium]
MYFYERLYANSGPSKQVAMLLTWDGRHAHRLQVDRLDLPVGLVWWTTGSSKQYCNGGCR